MGIKAVGGASGKHGRIIIENTATFGLLELCVTEWNLTENIQEEETTNSCSAGKREFEYGTRFIDVTLKMDLDLSQHPLDSPPGLIPGSAIPGIVFLNEHISASSLGNTTNLAWTIATGYAKIVSCSVSVPAVGKVTYEIHFKAGNYTSPYETGASA